MLVCVPAACTHTSIKAIFTPPRQTRQNSCLCRVHFGGVIWILDNSRLSPTENVKSGRVQSNCPIHTGTPYRLVASGITQTLCAIVPSCVFTQSVARKFVLIVCQRRRCCAVVTQRGSVELSRTDNGGPERIRARTMRVVFIEQNKHERRHVNSEPRAAAAAR